jgi:hypothetical protein
MLEPAAVPHIRFGRLSLWFGLFDRVDGGYWFLDLVCGGATRATSKKLMLDTTTQGR